MNFNKVIKFTQARKRFLCVFGLVAICVGCSQQPIDIESHAFGEAKFDTFQYSGFDETFDAPLEADQIANPILNGFYPDPSIVRVGEDFYMVHSTFGYFPGLPVFHSKDLKHWRQLGNAIDRPEQLDFEGIHMGYNGIYAPAIEYKNGTFYIITTCVGCGGNFIVTTQDPSGSWSQPIWLPDLEGIDPSIFFDDDGKTYIVHHKNPENKKYDAHTAIAVMEVDPQTFAPRSDDVMLVDGDTPAPWHTEYLEGPHLYKVNGKYYLSASGGGTEFYHSYLFYRSESVFGPYEPNLSNPVLTQIDLPSDRPEPITATGHGDIFTDINGDWWVVFLANRVYDLNKTPHGRFHTGRETFLLPVQWNSEGWPEILSPKVSVPTRITGPNLESHPFPENVQSGNFSYTEQFDKEELSDDWLFIRTPKETWWNIANGSLIITTREERVGDYKQPSFIGKRLAHMHATVSTSLDFPNQRVGEEAGLLAIQNDNNYVAFGVTINSDGKKVVQVRRRTSDIESELGEVIAELPLSDSGSTFKLDIVVDKGVMHFYFEEDNKARQQLLGDLDTGFLTSQVAGGFTGAVVGMYSQTNH